jgi:hypothetical protein
MVLAIEEETLQKLTKTQASILIERISEEKKAFAIKKAQEVLAGRSRRPASLRLFLFAVIAIALVSFVYFVAQHSPKRSPSTSRRSDQVTKEAVPAVSKPTLTSQASAEADLPAIQQWAPGVTEFVRLTAPVTLYNSRGKALRQLEAGKRLRVVKRLGDQVTINYVGDEYTISAAATEPSK